MRVPVGVSLASRCRLFSARQLTCPCATWYWYCTVSDGRVESLVPDSRGASSILPVPPTADSKTSRTYFIISSKVPSLARVTSGSDLTRGETGVDIANYTGYYASDNVAEWLRRWIANPLLYERESSNLSVVVLICF
jgi:hypothetical protein